MYAPIPSQHACCAAPQVKHPTLGMMSEAQQALSLLARWPLAAASRPSAIRGAACMLCQPIATSTAQSDSNCCAVPAIAAQTRAWSSAWIMPHEISSQLRSDGRPDPAATTALCAQSPLQPWAGWSYLRTPAPAQTQQQVRSATASSAGPRARCLRMGGGTAVAFAPLQIMSSKTCLSRRRGAIGRTRPCSRRGSGRRGCRAP